MLSGPEHETAHETHRPNRRMQSIQPPIFIHFAIAKQGKSIDTLLGDTLLPKLIFLSNCLTNVF